MKLPIKLSPQAEKDLIDIWQYTKGQWGDKQANAYLDKLNAGITKISEHPFIGIDYSHIRNGYRQFRIEQHHVFYLVGDSQVTIIRTLHTAMDAESRLPNA